MATKRRCTGKTKKGARCRANPLHGRKTCIAHSDKETQNSVGFGGPQEGSGRPRAPRVIEEMRRRVEEEVDDILAPYFDALRGAVLHAAYEGEVFVSDHPDVAARIAAAEKLLDRVYGRPRQVTEVTGEDGGPIQLEGELADPTVREALFDAARRIDAHRKR